MINNIYKKPKKKRKFKTKAQKEARKKSNEAKKQRRRSWWDKLNWAKQNHDKVKEFADNVCKTRIVNSEQWFMQLWEPFKVNSDLYNEAFDCYIPDMINHEYKYIIEIDGSIHNSPTQWKKDIKKNEYYARKGYYLYRITAYNFKRFEQIKNEILHRRKNWYDLRVNSFKSKGFKAI